MRATTKDAAMIPLPEGIEENTFGARRAVVMNIHAYNATVDRAQRGLAKIDRQAMPPREAREVASVLVELMTTLTQRPSQLRVLAEELPADWAKVALMLADLIERSANACDARFVYGQRDLREPLEAIALPDAKLREIAAKLSG